VRILTVVGTRPQLIKAAALIPELRQRHDETLVDTGQHWDDAMAGRFFRDLGLPRPDHALGAGGGSHAEQTAAMLRGIEPIARSVAPDVVLVYGDTNSTMAGALVAAKLGIPVAHVEAGLRSHDRSMPEEVDRLVTDHLARWLFAPTATAVSNLAAEGVKDGVHLVGDLMRDLVARIAPTVANRDAIGTILAAIADEATPPAPTRLAPGRYAYATVHRAGNRTAGALRRIGGLLDDVAAGGLPVVFAVHPGTRQAMAEVGIEQSPGVVLANPQSYRSSIALQLHAAAVVTDSGGVQREADWLGVPCLVLRESTEWVEALSTWGGRVVLVGVDSARAVAALGAIGTLDELAEEAAARAASVDVRPDGAAAAISSILGQAPAAG
jgi:UDP-N-acetylglucosamine 2-epimerase